MDQNQREDVGRRLAAMRQQILDRARDKGERASEVGVEVGDEADRSVSDEQTSLLAQLGSRDREQVMQIDDAIRRLNEGRYGECRSCGEPISAERLQVQPLAERCVDCQEAWERERSAPEDSKRRKM